MHSVTIGRGHSPMTFDSLLRRWRGWLTRPIRTVYTSSTVSWRLSASTMTSQRYVLAYSRMSGGSQPFHV